MVLKGLSFRREKLLLRLFRLMMTFLRVAAPYSRFQQNNSQKPVIDFSMNGKPLKMKLEDLKMRLQDLK